MTPGVYPMLLYRGDSYRWQFTCYADINEQTPANLTGVTVASQIRDRPGGSLICSIACTVTLPNLINGYLSASDCGTLPATAAWDLQLTYPSGDVATVLAGPVAVVPDVTNLTTVVMPASLGRVRRA